MFWKVISMKTPKTNSRPVIEIKVEIQPGPSSPAQKQAWNRFWVKLITQVKEEMKNELV